MPPGQYALVRVADPNPGVLVGSGFQNMLDPDLAFNIWLDPDPVLQNFFMQYLMTKVKNTVRIYLLNLLLFLKKKYLNFIS